LLESELSSPEKLALPLDERRSTMETARSEALMAALWPVAALPVEPGVSCRVLVELEVAGVSSDSSVSSPG